MSAVRSSSTPVPGFISAPGSNPRSHPAPSMRHLACSALAVLLALFAAAHASSAQDSPEVIRQKIEAEYPLTKTTASKDDIVTAGAVLVLEKDGLEMSSVASRSPAQNNYQNGKLSVAGGTIARKIYRKCPIPSLCPHTEMAGSFRTFVSGEKFWITSVDVQGSVVTLNFFSNPISDVRYFSTLQIPYTKSSAAAVLATIAEVIKVQPSDDAQPQDRAAPAQGAAAPAAPMAPIPPPPPPPDSPAPARTPAAPGAASGTRVAPAGGASNGGPKPVEIGQTKDQVFAILGAPTRIAKLPTKEIDFYPDMKITFVKDKVSDIQ